MALNPNIALGVRGIEVANPLAQYAQISQLQSAQNQNALAQYQLATAQREQESTNALNEAYRSAYNPQTGDIDINTLRKTLSTGGFGSKLPGLEKTLGELQAQKLTQQKLQGEITAQPIALQIQQANLADTKLKQSRAFLDTINPADPNAPAMYLKWHQANHSDPIIGPMLAARGVTADQSRAQIDAAIAQGPQAFAQLLNQSKLGTEKFMELNKPTTQVVDQSGQKQMFQIPGLGGAPTSIGTYADVPLPGPVLAQKKEIARAGASNITQTTEKKYGEQFAGKIADSDSNKLGAAEKAPQLAESANRIINLVSQGNLFTGPIADVKLNIARALNVVGASNDEKIANTEALIAATGQSTLDAIKGAGLGTGQGFTDKDLKFLQGIAGGAITYTPQTLTELATLQHRVATRSVENWNRRFKEIPKSATEGLGIKAAPDVPALSSGAKAAAAPRPAGVGANWTFENDAAGNKAWVSPDRKSFKEVQ
jgi:hypothetical protein